MVLIENAKSLKNFSIILKYILLIKLGHYELLRCVDSRVNMIDFSQKDILHSYVRACLAKKSQVKH